MRIWGFYVPSSQYVELPPTEWSQTTTSRGDGDIGGGAAGEGRDPGSSHKAPGSFFI